MRIAVDIRHVHMYAPMGGTQVMIQALRALKQFDDSNEYIFYNKSLGKFGSRGSLARIISSFLADYILKNVWLPIWSRLNRIDALLYFLPPCSLWEMRIPQYCYIHDIAPEFENNSFQNRLYNSFIKRTCRKATIVLTGSKFTADDVREKYDLPEDKIKVVPYAIDLDFLKRMNEPSKIKDFLAEKSVSEGFVLGVISQMVERKCPGAYLEVYSRLPKDLRVKHKLVIAGCPKSLDDFASYVNPEVIAEIKDDVVVLGLMSDEELALSYSAASVLLFPSKHEGFGLPVIEALACGTHVVGSNIPPVAEVGGECTFLFDVDNYDKMSACLADILLDSGRFSGKLDAGLSWVKRYSYKDFTGNLINVMR